MIVAIRLSRTGNRNNPSYKINVTDSKSPRDGRYIENIGFYSPLYAKNDERYFKINIKKFDYWTSKGAKASDKVLFLIKKDKERNC